MKILIHALGANMGGAIRHLDNFIPALVANDKSNQYILILRKDVKTDFKDEALHVVKVLKYIGTNFFLRTIFDAFYLPFLAIKLKADVVISLLNFGPIFCTKPHINFQRNSLYFCDYYLDNITGSEKLFTKLRSVLLYLTMKFADIIVTPSISMIDQIKTRYPSLANKKYRTIQHGFKSGDKDFIVSKWDGILKEETRIKLLYPTHPATYKGFEILFEALAKFKTSNPTKNFIFYTTTDISEWPLGIEKFNAQIKKLYIEENVIFTGRIPQDQIHLFYKNCDLMIYPSLCESFGFSMLEAMGYGIPIVAADTPINKEICEDAAVYYSAFDPNDAAKKIAEGLKKSIREDLVNAAKKRITSFDWSWDRYASQFISLVNTFHKN
jgi:glycosyltransferase involved in cell wall biosynthesis